MVNPLNHKFIHIKATTLWDERNEEFIHLPEATIELEHSLATISKWEAKWGLPFLSEKKKTPEQLIDYIRIMAVNETKIDKRIFDYLSGPVYKVVQEFIDAPMSATWFREDKQSRGRGRIITSELIYYWMIALNIPIECEHWHLNRLLTLIKVCNEESKPREKRKPMDNAALRERDALNKQRQQQLNTHG